MTLGLVQAAVAYHGAFPVEVDERIERNEQLAAEAHFAWLAGHSGSTSLKLLLDEMLSSVIADQLRALGHDVEAVKGDPAREGLADSEVMPLARVEHRAVVTNNLDDFRALHHEAALPGGQGHFGMVFMPGNGRTKADVGRIAAALQAELDRYPGDNDLANGETWL